MPAGLASALVSFSRVTMVGEAGIRPLSSLQALLSVTFKTWNSDSP